MDKTPIRLTFRELRKVSGFSRPMSVWDAFMYNFLTMGVIFPWTYLWAPASFPGGSIEWAIVITLLVQIPISIAYCYLATVLPVTGGDYVYQARAFGKWGFVSVMSGFVIWILQWVALSGWLFATLGLAPLLLSLGVYTGHPGFSKLGMLVQSPLGVVTVSILLALFTTLFLIRGMRLYVKVQKFLFWSTLAAILAVIYTFVVHGNSLADGVNLFVNRLIHQIHMTTNPQITNSFSGFLEKDVAAHGFNISPTFSVLATLGIVPIAWTSLQWATYSVEQSTEIAEADRFWKQVLMLVGSAVAVAGCLFLVAHFEKTALSEQFMNAASAAYWAQQASSQSITIVKTVLQPFPNILAMAGSGSVIISVLIALGFLANSFQITCNCFIGVTRIMVGMGIDGLLPRKLELDNVDPERHSPVRAHWAYLIASLPIIVGYNLINTWSNYTLGVTFACGYVFVLSALAATRIPTRMHDLWQNSDIRHFSPILIRVVSSVGFAMGGAMVIAYLIVPQLGLTGIIPYAVVFGIVFLSYMMWIYAKRKHPLLEKAMVETPAEVDQFYR